MTKPLRKLLGLVGAVVVAASIAAAGYLYWQNRQLRSNPAAQSQDEATALVAKVGKIFELPTGETPTIATVNDEAQLKDQPFFVNAKKGDKTLIYTEAKKAILYRPSTNKIIEVAPINSSKDANTSG